MQTLRICGLVLVLVGLVTIGYGLTTFDFVAQLPVKAVITLQPSQLRVNAMFIVWGSNAIDANVTNSAPSAISHTVAVTVFNSTAQIDQETFGPISVPSGTSIFQFRLLRVSLETANVTSIILDL